MPNQYKLEEKTEIIRVIEKNRKDFEVLTLGEAVDALKIHMKDSESVDISKLTKDMLSGLYRACGPPLVYRKRSFHGNVHTNRVRTIAKVILEMYRDNGLSPSNREILESIAND